MVLGSLLCKKPSPGDVMDWEEISVLTEALPELFVLMWLLMFPWFAELGPTSSQAPVGLSRLLPALQTHCQSVLSLQVFFGAK